MTIKIRVSKATSEDAAYARMNDRVNSIEVKNTEQDSIIEKNTADIEILNSFKNKVESVIDVDGSSNTLVLNVGEDKIRLIFNDNKTVTWDYLPLVNNSNISTTEANVGDSFEVFGAATGGKKPYTYSYYYKRSSAEKWSEKLVNTTATSVTMNPTAAGEWNIKTLVKDGRGVEVEKIFNVTVVNG